MLKFLLKIVLLLISLNSYSELKAQSIGFGCFGFVSGFGGYSYQSIEPGYLKYYSADLGPINTSVPAPNIEQFNNLKGFRFGLNFFRVAFSGIFLSTKGYYQILSEKKNINISDSNPDFEYDLDFKTWGLGIDVGIPITTFLSWKVLDGELMFNSARFKRTINEAGSTSVKRFNNDSPDLGYSIGTGFIVYLVERYISLEGTAGYTIMKIEKMQDDDGNNFLDNTDTGNENYFVRAGGFKALLQINIGFPL